MSDKAAELYQSREKKKWQIALRRYVIEKQPSTRYAPYFGLDIAELRNWIELQFNEGQNWSNFGVEWQLEHVLPARFFNLQHEDDRQLCWNFINIRVEQISGGAGIISPWLYFSYMYNKTGLLQCKKMMNKIETLMPNENNHKLTEFLKSNKNVIETLASWNETDFLRINKGEGTWEQIIKEKEIVKKFGS